MFTLGTLSPVARIRSSWRRRSSSRRRREIENGFVPENNRRDAVFVTKFMSRIRKSWVTPLRHKLIRLLSPRSHNLLCSLFCIGDSFCHDGTWGPEVKICGLSHLYRSNGVELPEDWVLYPLDSMFQCWRSDRSQWSTDPISDKIRSKRKS